MKKLSLVLCFMIIFSCIGCGSSDSTIMSDTQSGAELEITEEITSETAVTEAPVSEDTASESKIDSATDYTLKVKMTPDMASKIKEYNKKQESKGSYNNDTLTCYDYNVDKYNGNKAKCTEAGYTFEDNKCKATNIFCYSSFVDKLVEGKFGGEVDAKNRAEAKNASYKAYSNPSAEVTNKYGSSVTNDYWTVNIYNSLCVDDKRNAGGTCTETNYPVIGPSWK